MSRSYDHYCPECNGSHARINDDIDSPNIVQCLDCGATFLKEKRIVYTWLTTIGTDDKAWKRALNEGYSKVKDENNGIVEVRLYEKLN